MDGISKIIERIEDDSRREIADIVAESAAKCAEIKAEYKKLEEQKYGEALSNGAADAAQRFERLKNVAELEAKKALLAEKQSLMDKAFSLAAQKLLELPEDDYIVLVSKLAANASQTGEELLIFSEADRAKIGKTAVKVANKLLSGQGKPAHLELSDDTREISGGVIVSGGDIETNCSLEALVAEYRNELSPRVAGVLFE